MKLKYLLTDSGVAATLKGVTYKFESGLVTEVPADAGKALTEAHIAVKVDGKYVDKIVSDSRFEVVKK